MGPHPQLTFELVGNGNANGKSFHFDQKRFAFMRTCSHGAHLRLIETMGLQASAA